MKKLIFIIIIFNTILLSLVGCSSPPSKFYILNPISSHTNVQGKIKSYIGLERIELANYLQQSQVVTRTKQNQLELNEFNRWAEPLKENLQTVLKTNLQILLPHSLILNYPWKSSQAIDYTVTVSINKFEANYQGNCILQASYEIKTKAGQVVKIVNNQIFNTRVNNKDYNSIVAGMNSNLAQLSRTIAGQIRTLTKH